MDRKNALMEIVEGIKDKKAAMQVAYLYSYLLDNGREAEYGNIKADCIRAGVRTEDEWQEVIKCITHGLPYKPVISGPLDPAYMLHVRRYMEDTGCTDEGSPYYGIAKKLLSSFKDKNVFYEFRRFNKASVPITYEQDKWLFQWISGFNPGWMAVAAVYEVYCEKGFSHAAFFAGQWTAEAAGKWDLELQVKMFSAAKDIMDIYK